MREWTDLNGNLIVDGTHDYTPFGTDLYYGEQRDGQRQQFASYERDSETGLDYAQARYFSNVQGRFTSADPLMASAIAVNPQSWNRYSYTINNPLKYVDPSGLAWGYFSGNGGNFYKWFDDEADIEKNGGTVVKANAGNNGFIYEGGGGWVRLDLSQNKWTQYETNQQAFYDQREFPTAMGDLENTLNLFGALHAGAGLANTALGRILNPSSGITTLGLSSATSATATAAENTTIPLFRAVMQSELDDVISQQAFRNPFGIEVKYFSATAEGAASYARQAHRAFGDGPFTLVETRIPANLVNSTMRATVDRGINTVTVPTELLPQLSRPRIWNFSPLPGK
jgi:RHS repeat-associated protein